MGLNAPPPPPSLVPAAVVTDGKPYLRSSDALAKYGAAQSDITEFAEAQASVEKAKGYTLNAIGVGSENAVSSAFLENIASEPKERHWTRIDTFASLADHATTVRVSCGTEVGVEPGMVPGVPRGGGGGVLGLWGDVRATGWAVCWVTCRMVRWVVGVGGAPDGRMMVDADRYATPKPEPSSN